MTETGVQNLYTEGMVYSDLLNKKRSGRSLRAIAGDYPGLNFADISRALKGQFPKSNSKRWAFGLMNYADVQLITDGQIPPGSQAISAKKCIDCPQWFIPNNPNRKRCFICSPFRGK